MATALIPSSVVERLGWVLVHSLWQFTLLACVAALVQRAMRRSSAAARFRRLLDTGPGRRPVRFLRPAGAGVLAIVFLLGLAVSVGVWAQARSAKVNAQPANGNEPAGLSVRIRAMDARTSAPLKSLTIIPAPHNERVKHVTWQSQYLKRYAGGPVEFRMERGWDSTVLRIEADGYVPFITAPIRRGGGQVTLDVPLEPDPRLAGRVLLHDGKPAGGASLALCTWTNEVEVEGGKLRYSGHGRDLGKLGTAAADGSFRVPTEVDPWVLVVAHDGGYAEVTAAEFAKSSTVRLKPWGRIEGEFVLGGKPVAGQTIHLGAGRGDVEVNLHYTGDVVSDAAGRFVAQRVPPVILYITPWFKHGDRSFNLLWFSGRTSIAAGQTTRITLPRPGRPVVGRVSLAQQSGLRLEDVSIEMSVSLRPPGMSRMFEDQSDQGLAAYRALVERDLGRAYQRDKIAANADGTFRIEGLPETHYLLTITAYRKPASPGADRGAAVARRIVRVEVPPLADSKEPVDLGNLVLAVSAKKPPRPPAAVPPKPAKTDGSQKADAALRVRVVESSGKMLPRAKIHASVWTSQPFQANRDYVCDARGEAQVELPQSVDILRLWAHAEGYVPLFAHWESDELQGDGSRIPGEFTFELPKGTVIGGIVENEDGQPIAGAKVEVMLRHKPDQERKRVLFNIWLAEGDDGRMTDAEGRWTLDNVPPGDDVEVLVRLSHPDYVSDYHWGVMQSVAEVATAMLRKRTGTIVMPRGIRVTGTVTDPNGKPVAGAVVAWGDDPYGMPGSQEVRTDERGVYRFPPLPPMSVTVTVIAPGWAPELKETTITRENPPVDFELKPGKTLRLRFVDDAGKPIPEVGVGIAGWRGGKSLYNDQHPNVLDTKIPNQADNSGVYQWTWAPPDEVEYSFGKKGYQFIENEPHTADGVMREVRLARLAAGLGPGPKPTGSSKSAAQPAPVAALPDATDRLVLEGAKVTDESLDQLKGRRLDSLMLYQTDVTDEGLARLRAFGRLKSLRLVRNVTTRQDITDAGLAHLKDLATLELLDLSNTAVSDRGIAQLKGLTRLTSLSLSGTDVSGAGLQGLVELPNLRSLYLDKFQAEAGLEHLKRMKRLSRLEVSRHQMDEPFMAKLREALPNCQVGFMDS